MTRRTFLLASAALPAIAAADPASDVWDVVSSMAAALAEDNAPGFMKSIDLRLPAYDTLSRDIAGMLAQSEPRSGVTLIRNDGDDYTRTIEVDWELRLKRKADDTRIEVRRRAVTMKLVRDRKRWMVVELDPISMFAPPNFR